LLKNETGEKELHDIIHILGLEKRRDKKETIITCCRELQAMLTHGGGQATFEQSNPNGSSRTFMVIIIIVSV
jgi:F0F1-type ATP synthase beta subunit